MIEYETCLTLGKFEESMGVSMNSRERCWRTLLVLATVVCSGALWASAQEVTKPSADIMFGTLNTSVDAKSVPLSEALPASSLKGMGYWDAGNEILWAVTESKSEAIDGATLRRLAFYSVQGDKAKPLGSYETIDGFVNAPVTSEENGQLVSVWTGGSAYHVVVFDQTQKAGIGVIEEFGSETFPIILDDNAQQPVLIGCREWQVTKGSSVTPKTADIYRITPDGRYELWKQVDWKKRFSAASVAVNAKQRK
jgi:hypothetical protein